MIMEEYYLLLKEPFARYALKRSGFAIYFVVDSDVNIQKTNAFKNVVVIVLCTAIEIID